MTLLLSEKFRKIESFIKSGSFQPPCVNYGYVEKLPFLQTIFLAWLGFLIAVTRDNGKFLTICHTNLYIELCSRASTKLYHFMFLRSFLSRKWECFSAKNLTYCKIFFLHEINFRQTLAERWCGGLHSSLSLSLSFSLYLPPDLFLSLFLSISLSSLVSQQSEHVNYQLCLSSTDSSLVKMLTKRSFNFKGTVSWKFTFIKCVKDLG